MEHSMKEFLVVSFNGYYELVGEQEIFKDVKYYKLDPDDDYNTLLSVHNTFNKIAIIPYVFIDQNTMEPAKEYGGQNLSLDLRNFDQVIVVCYEILMGPIDEHLAILQKQYNNTNIRIINTDTMLAEDRTNSNIFLYPVIMTDVWYTNQYRDTSNSSCKIKLFDALLGINKAHRKFVFYNLHKANLLEKSLVSLTSLPNETKTGKRRTWYYSSELRRLETSDVTNTIEEKQPFSGFNLIGHSKPLSHQVPWNIYAHSWYSIVAETHIDILHTTEKLGKPLLAKRLFVLFAAPFMLERLHNLGFKTFDKIIDESYDREIDNEKRWSMAFDQIIALSKLDPVEVYKQVDDVVTYNHQLALDKEYWFSPLRNWIFKN